MLDVEITCSLSYTRQHFKLLFAVTTYFELELQNIWKLNIVMLHLHFLVIEAFYLNINNWPWGSVKQMMISFKDFRLQSMIFLTQNNK